MKSDKFYEFVKSIAGKDVILAEAIIGGHKTIFEAETLHEGKLANLAAAGGLALGLGAATPAQAWSPFSSDKETSIQAEVPQAETVQAKTKQLLKEVANDFIETNSFSGSKAVESLAMYINSLPEDMKTVALSECSRFRNQFKLGSPSDNIVTALGEYQVAMR